MSQKVKAAVRRRDGYECVECGMTGAEHAAEFGSDLQVHRITPGSRYTVRGCVTLCCRCHGPKPRRLHGTRKPLRFTEEEMRRIRIVFQLQDLSPTVRRKFGSPFRHQADFMRACIFWVVERAEKELSRPRPTHRQKK